MKECEHEYYDGFGREIFCSPLKLFLVMRLMIEENQLEEVALPYDFILYYNHSFMRIIFQHVTKPNGLQGKYLGIHNVYVSNMVGERFVIYNEVLRLLHTNCRWMMTYDLKVVESPLDMSTSSCTQLMSLKEDLKNKSNIENYFNRGNGPIYSWDIL